MLCGIRMMWIIGLCFCVMCMTSQGPCLRKAFARDHFQLSGFCMWSLLTQCAFFRQMPTGRSLKEQRLKFVGLEYLHVFGLAQGTKTSSSWQHSMSENQVPLGTVSPEDEKANCHSSIACCCPRPLCSPQYLWPVARAPCLAGLPLVSLSPPSISSILMVVVHLPSTKSRHGILPWLDFCIFF